MKDGNLSVVMQKKEGAARWRNGEVSCGAEKEVPGKANSPHSTQLNPYTQLSLNPTPILYP
jgi:hypothetical protein